MMPSSANLRESTIAIMVLLAHGINLSSGGVEGERRKAKGEIIKEENGEWKMETT